MVGRKRRRRHNTDPMVQLELRMYWVLFLQAALRDRTLQVDKEFYKSWGDVGGVHFTEWFLKHPHIWGDHKAPAVEVVSGSAETGTVAKPGRLLVSIDATQPRMAVLKEVGELVRRQPQAESKSKFVISNPKAQTDSLEKALGAYEAWLAKGGDMAAAAQTYFKHVQTNHKLWDLFGKVSGEKNLLKLEEMGWEKRGKGLDSIQFERDQKKFRTYVTMGRRIAANVARGEFPGPYGDRAIAKLKGNTPKAAKGRQR